MNPKPKILVVDDEPLIIMLIEKTLEDAGFDIITAYDGEEGLQKVDEYNPDLIILDVIMPKLDGLEVCRRLKSNDKTRLIPVVMLTSKDFVDDKITGFETGADDYIFKPFIPKEFLARIKGLVNRTIYQHQRAEGEKQEALEKMVEGIAHEVRNPVVAIGGFARRISNKLPPDDQLKYYAEHIIQEVMRLETMINEIIKFRTVVVTFNNALDPTTTVDLALQKFSNEIREKEISVHKEYCPSLPAVRGDRDNLTAAFSGIIENALEAMQHGDSLTIKSSLRKEWIFIEISDTGQGIPPKELAQVTRPFYTSKMSGAGMGLTMVKHILLLHGGEMSIASKQGRGTRVTIQLPAGKDKTLLGAAKPQS